MVGFRFTKRTDQKEIAFSVKRYTTTWSSDLTVSGTDVVWVKGTAAQLESLLKRRKSLNGQLASAWVGFAVLGLVAALLIGLLWLVLAAAQTLDRGDWGRDAGLGGSIVITVVVFVAIAVLQGYFFPFFELYHDDAIPAHIKMRSLALTVGGALLIGTLASLMAAGLILLV
jgi:hypothetical protein